MLRKLRARLTYANVVSTVCLFIVLGGSAYAASQLPSNSVGSAQVVDNSLTGADINESKLGAVPFASDAGDSKRLGGVPSWAYALHRDLGPEGVHFVQPASFNCASSPGTFCQFNTTDEIWKNQSPNSEKVGFFKDSGGLVHLQGWTQIQLNNNGLAAFYLPQGYRPPTGQTQDVPAAAVCGGGATDVEITHDGAVFPRGDCVSFDGIVFRPGS